LKNKKPSDYLVIRKQPNAMNNIATVERIGHSHKSKLKLPNKKAPKSHRNKETMRSIIPIIIKIRGDFGFVVSSAFFSMFLSRLNIHYLLINKSFGRLSLIEENT